MKIITRTLLLAILAIASVTPSFAACEADGVDVASADLDINAFASILRSAQVTGCEQVAHDKLYAKLGTIAARPTSPWKGMRSGIAMSFALSSGLILGARGYLDDPLDDRLARAANAYVVTIPQDPADPELCGMGGTRWKDGNTCFEEFAIGTAGRGWTTAYYRLTGRDWLNDRQLAYDAFKSALSEQGACIHNPAAAVDPNNRGICNGSLADLVNGVAGLELVTLNHTVQNPSYGIGQMTHIAAGFAALEIAKRPIDPATVSSTYKNMAAQVWREGVAKAASNGAWAYNCRILNNAHQLNATFSNMSYGCYDLQKTDPADFYRADMFPIDTFYTKYGFAHPVASGQFDFKNEGAGSFPMTSAVYWPGRYTAYVTMGKHWLLTPPAMRSNGRYKFGLIRSASWYLVNSGLNTTPTATATTSVQPRPADASFVIEDLTTSTAHLSNGDTVTIRNKDGYYLDATGANGSLVVAHSFAPGSVPSTAKFTIWKGGVYVNEPIAHNDLVAFKTSNGLYWLAAPTGGSLVLTTTSGGDSFTLERFKTE
ncbi:MAG TPA: hypothetical protein VF698_15590 [Thermoanaerobaculia bacterium]|jgi:hypothetical protein